MNTNEYHMTWDEARQRAQKYQGRTCYGIPRGGSYVAAILGNAVDDIEQAEYLVDDVMDSGKTAESWLSKYPNKKFFCLVDKTTGADKNLGWIVFPWESADNEYSPTNAVTRLLEYIGEDCTREGLVDTPERVTRALSGLTSGMKQDPKAILNRVFSSNYDEMILVKNIPFVSLCEHHIMPFWGIATVGYIPRNGRVVGLSKIPRLVQCFAKRLQIQENMTHQIAHTMNSVLNPTGVGVIITATHSCMKFRGANSDGNMITSCLIGAMKQEPETRAEFLSFAKEMRI